MKYIPIVAGLVAAVVCFLVWRGTNFAGDLTWSIRGTRLLLAGHNPYSTDLVHLPPYSINPRLLYPLPALLILAPISWLPEPLIGAVFVGVSIGLMVWALRKDYWRLVPILLSAPLWDCVVNVQWGPLLVFSVLSSCAYLALAKPGFGLAVLAWRIPSWREVSLGLGIILLSFVISPGWFEAWFENVRTALGYHAPLLVGPGILLILSLLAWKTKEGRVVIALALVPQGLFTYDPILLWLAPKSLRYGLLLSLCSWVPWFIHYQYGVLQWMYFPALAIILWQIWKEQYETPSFGISSHFHSIRNRLLNNR